MPSNFFYWDSNVFLSYINGIEDRLQEIEDVWAEVADDADKRIVASVIAIVEVAHAAMEKEQKKLDADTEAKIDGMWYNPSVALVELSPHISFMARGLMRDVIPNGWTLKPNDAVHLATAMWVNQTIGPVGEIHTYNGGLNKYSGMIGISICGPHVLQPKLMRD